MAEIVTKKVFADQFLRKEGKADSDAVELDGNPLQVFAGEKVKTGAKDTVLETVDGNPRAWVFVEATGGNNADKRKGFVSGGFLVAEGTEVLSSGGFQPFPAHVEKAAFADACYVQAELNKTNPAYLYALAVVQSGSQWNNGTEVKTDDPVDALSFGVYQFTKETWADLLKLPETSGLTADQIKFPTAQCVVAAVLAAKSASLLKERITDHGLSAVDLYLAHMFADDKSFGSNAAAKILQAENKTPAQQSVDVIKQIYADDTVRAAFLKRNKAIFKEDGTATIADALKTCTDKFAAGFEEAKKLAHEIQKSIPPSADGPIFSGKFSGNVIQVTDQDVDALARVSESEVGNFGMFGEDVLARALGAVVDTIFNRVVYPTKEFPKTIQDVIDQKKQFSAINDVGTWQNLPKAPVKHFEIVQNHVQGRAQGGASELKGATHFFNPDTSNPDWGQPIRDNPVATYGKPKNSHIHGFPKGYHPPEAYAIEFGKDASVFSGDGQPQGQLIRLDKSVTSIVAAAIKEWEFWGKSVLSKVHHIDNEIEFATYVLNTYCKPLSANPSLSDIQHDKYFWSAVTISYMIRQAGLTASEFTFSQSHSTYIREAIKARKNEDKSKAYWGFRIGEPEAALAVGDIVGAGRTKGMTFDEAQSLFDKTEDYESHSDIVVAVRPGEADVIGGNVRDSVTKKTLPLDAKGKISDKKNLSFVVMKKN
jgi:spore germination cell wall hydrolase CwlJ-like protein